MHLTNLQKIACNTTNLKVGRIRLVEAYFAFFLTLHELLNALAKKLKVLKFGLSK